MREITVNREQNRDQNFILKTSSDNKYRQIKIKQYNHIKYGEQLSDNCNNEFLNKILE